MYLVAGAAEDDWVLQVIMLVGTVCNDDISAKMLAESNIIQSLIELLNGEFAKYSIKEGLIKFVLKIIWISICKLCSLLTVKTS